MLRKLGIESRLQLAMMLCVVSLVVVTTLGGSGGAPWVFFTYRSLLILIAIAGAMGSRRNDSTVRPAFLAGAGVLFGLMLISVFRVSGSHFEGFYLWYRYAFFAAAFLSLALYARSQSAPWRTVSIVAVVVVNLAYLLPELILRRGIVAGFSTNNANYFGTFLLIGLGCSLAAAAFASPPVWRIAAAISSTLIFFGIVKTSSRGAALAAAVMLIVAAIRSRGRVPRQAWAAAGLAAILAALVASPYMIRKFTDRGEIDPYNYARKEIWLNSLEVVKQSPMLGVGPGQFFNVSKRYTLPVDGPVARYMKRAQMAHNEYLQFIAEIGVPAALLLFAMLAWLVYGVVRRTDAAGSDLRWIHEAAILAATGVGAHALVDNCWTIPVTASSLVVLALADPLPITAKPERRRWTTPQLAFAGAALAAIYAVSTAIPGLGLYYNELGHRAFDRDDFATAERYHLAAIRIAPNNSLFLDNLGMVFLQQFTETHEERLLDLSMQYFRRAIQASPQSLDPYIHMEGALFRSMTGNAARDREVYREIVQVDTALLTVDPFVPFPRKNLAAAYYALGQYDRAFTELGKSIEYEPNFVPAYLQMGAWYGERGDVTQSRRYTAAAIEIVNRYRSYKPTVPYEAVLLGRPEQSATLAAKK